MRHREPHEERGVHLGGLAACPESRGELLLPHPRPASLRLVLEAEPDLGGGDSGQLPDGLHHGHLHRAGLRGILRVQHAVVRDAEGLLRREGELADRIVRSALRRGRWSRRSGHLVIQYRRATRGGELEAGERLQRGATAGPAAVLCCDLVPRAPPSALPALRRARGPVPPVLPVAVDRAGLGLAHFLGDSLRVAAHLPSVGAMHQDSSRPVLRDRAAACR
mmetsp:Transcript_92793/g.266824  ORF Transcript_92793/g.266824 Transcript_92793/m.266824 type:complete len:221 (-) Transcript_92793:733-1395(-)